MCRYTYIYVCDFSPPRSRRRSPAEADECRAARAARRTPGRGHRFRLGVNPINMLGCCVSYAYMLFTFCYCFWFNVQYFHVAFKRNQTTSRSTPGRSAPGLHLPFDHMAPNVCLSNYCFVFSLYFYCV